MAPRWPSLVSGPDDLDVFVPGLDQLRLRHQGSNMPFEENRKEEMRRGRVDRGRLEEIPLISHMREIE